MNTSSSPATELARRSAGSRATAWRRVFARRTTGTEPRDQRGRYQLAAKTLLLAIPSGTAAANLLRTRFFDGVLEGAPDLQIILLSPLSQEKHFVEEFRRPRVELIDMPGHEPGAIERRVIRVMQE